MSGYRDDKKTCGLSTVPLPFLGRKRTPSRRGDTNSSETSLETSSDSSGKNDAVRVATSTKCRSSSLKRKEPRKKQVLSMRDDDDSDSSSSMEVPYTQNLGLPGGIVRRLDDKPKEPLRPGDVLLYYHPMYVAGARAGLRITQVLEVNPHQDICLELDNGEVLPKDTQVKRCQEYVNGRLIEHPGVFRCIESFRLRQGTLEEPDGSAKRSDFRRHVERLYKIFMETKDELQKMPNKEKKDYSQSNSDDTDSDKKLSVRDIDDNSEDDSSDYDTQRKSQSRWKARNVPAKGTKPLRKRRRLSPQRTPKSSSKKQTIQLSSSSSGISSVDDVLFVGTSGIKTRPQTGQNIPSVAVSRDELRTAEPGPSRSRKVFRKKGDQSFQSSTSSLRSPIFSRTGNRKAGVETAVGANTNDFLSSDEESDNNLNSIFGAPQETPTKTSDGNMKSWQQAEQVGEEHEKRASLSFSKHRRERQSHQSTEPLNSGFSLGNKVRRSRNASKVQLKAMRTRLSSSSKSSLGGGTDYKSTCELDLSDLSEEDYLFHGRKKRSTKKKQTKTATTSSNTDQVRPRSLKESVFRPQGLDTTESYKEYGCIDSSDDENGNYCKMLKPPTNNNTNVGSNNKSIMNSGYASMSSIQTSSQSSRDTIEKKTTPKGRTRDSMKLQLAPVNRTGSRFDDEEDDF